MGLMRTVFIRWMDHVCKLNNEEDELFSFGIIQLNKKLRIIRDYCLAIYIYFLCREMHPLFSEQNLNFFLGHHQYFLFLLICRSREMKAQRAQEKSRERVIEERRAQQPQPPPSIPPPPPPPLPPYPTSPSNRERESRGNPSVSHGLR
jgi:hypothetical protein